MTGMSRFIAHGVMVAVFLMLALGLALAGDRTILESVAVTVGAITYAAAGWVVATRQSTNPIGWIMLFFGFNFALDQLSVAYIDRALPGSEWFALANATLWLPAIVSIIVLVPLLFPGGRLPSPRWRCVPWFAGVGVVLFIWGNLFAADLLSDFGLPNPLARWDDTHPIAFFGLIFIVISLVAAVAAAVIRFRRSKGATRQQMKWFAAAAMILVPVLIGMGTAYESGRPELARAIFMLGSLPIPLAIGMAILRYRLYEIDRIISRTVTYTLVVGLLALAVALVATVTAAQFENPLVVAGTTLAVAALFNPLRRRVQVWVDRRFNRSRYDTERVIDQFAGTLRDQVDPEGVVDGWLGVVSETMEPEAVGVWVRR